MVRGISRHALRLSRDSRGLSGDPQGMSRDARRRSVGGRRRLSLHEMRCDASPRSTASDLQPFHTARLKNVSPSSNRSIHTTETLGVGKECPWPPLNFVLLLRLNRRSPSAAY